MINIIICSSVIGFINSFNQDKRFKIEAVLVERRFYANDLINFSNKNNIKLISVKNNLDILSNVNKLNSNFLVMFGFGIILKPSILGVIDCINLHMGILPFYRGRHVVFHALMNEESEIGMTLHKVDGNIDTGEIIDIFKVSNSEYVYGNYFIDHISSFSTKILNSIHSYRKHGKMNRVKNKIGCYYPRITKNDITIILKENDKDKLLKLNKIQKNTGFYIKYKEYEFKIRNLRIKEEFIDFSGVKINYDEFNNPISFTLSNTLFSFDLINYE